jgi:Tol biopolymer transport system component
MTIAGQDARDVCDGAMPSWSADGHQFACSRYAAAAGVWIMNLDGSAEKRIDDGWGAQWSPDGKLIAYTNDNSLRIYDVASGKTRTLLAKGSHPYRYIYWNMAWSPDSQRLVFKGKLDDQQSEIGIVKIGDADLARRFKSAVPMGNDFAWTTDGQEILFPMQSAQDDRQLIYRMDAAADDSPTRDAFVGDKIDATSICFSRDGEWMILATTNEG